MQRIETQLTTVRSSDGTPLDGVIYTGAPRAGRREHRTVVNFLHGRSMNFFTGLGRFAATDLVGSGYDVVAINRRSASIAGIRDSFQGVGDAWTLWSEHRMDVEAVVRHLRCLGYRRIVMVGHSQGGLLAADYTARDPSVAGLILAAPAPITGLPIILPDGPREEVLARARAMVVEGRGRELLLLPAFPWVISASAAVDPFTPGLVIPLENLTARYLGPLLVFCGDAEQDPRMVSAARSAFEHSRSRVKHLEVLEGCGHFYVGFEDRVTALMRGWLEVYVPPG
jgi:pimeloyl-ACP methyl ester carboxylesterase